jgi:exodeoxyribonuclease VII large subunit
MADRKAPPPGRSLTFDFGSALTPTTSPAAPALPPASHAEGDLAPPAAFSAPSPPPAPVPAAETLTVAQLGRMLGRSIERAFPAALWVEGEVSGARPAPSGHLYFTLKDEEEEATIDVVVYRTNVTPRARALVKDGARVRVRFKPSWWSPRGRLQLVGDRLEPTGKGALLEALEKLKAKLAAEGLFAPERKRALPSEPRVIGVVTSKTGAVIHDICKVAFRRGDARILLAPAQVQGVGSAESVRRGLRALQRIPEVDVIIVGRGGGSQDDLLAFWDEELVRDIAASRVPVVSAVGHEVDVTLVDHAADARAATPSQAAEMVVPDTRARRRLLDERAMRLKRAVHARVQEDRVAHARLTRAFRDPRLLIASAQQLVDDRVMRLGRATNRRVARERDVSARLAMRLGAAHPRERIARDRARVLELRARASELARSRLSAEAAALAALGAVLGREGNARLREDRVTLGRLAARLDAMSPLKVLGRGYAIATRAADGRAVRAASELTRGDVVRVRVGEGAFEAEVSRVQAKNRDREGDGNGSGGAA